MSSPESNCDSNDYDSQEEFHPENIGRRPILREREDTYKKKYKNLSEHRKERNTLRENANNPTGKPPSYNFLPKFKLKQIKEFASIIKDNAALMKSYGDFL